MYDASAAVVSAEIELRRGRFDVARKLAIEGAEIGAVDGEQWVIAGCRIVEAWAAHESGDGASGRAAADAALVILEQYFPEGVLTPPALEVAALLVLEEASDGAAEILHAAEVHRQSLELPREELERDAVERAWSRIAETARRNDGRAAPDAAAAIARARSLLHATR